MEISHPFQGVACCCLESDKLVEDTIVNKLLGLELNSVTHHGISCFELKLANKYYETTIHLFDYDRLDSISSNPETEVGPISNRLDNDSILDRCQAIILHGNGQTLTTGQLDDKVKQFKNVNGEPRILLYYGIDEDCESYATLTDWCLTNGYDFINTTDDDAREQLINSLSVYQWNHRLSSNPTREEINNTSGSSITNNEQSQSPLNNDTLKKIMEFDTLLGKLSAYRDRPEIRGRNPDDKNIEEIAKILSGLLGDDVDAFLENDDDTNNKSKDDSKEIKPKDVD